MPNNKYAKEKSGIHIVFSFIPTFSAENSIRNTEIQKALVPWHLFG